MAEPTPPDSELRPIVKRAEEVRAELERLRAELAKAMAESQELLEQLREHQPDGPPTN